MTPRVRCLEGHPCGNIASSSILDEVSQARDCVDAQHPDLNEQKASLVRGCDFTKMLQAAAQENAASFKDVHDRLLRVEEACTKYGVLPDDLQTLASRLGQTERENTTVLERIETITLELRDSCIMDRFKAHIHEEEEKAKITRERAQAFEAEMEKKTATLEETLDSLVGRMRDTDVRMNEALSEMACALGTRFETASHAEAADMRENEQGFQITLSRLEEQTSARLQELESQIEGLQVVKTIDSEGPIDTIAMMRFQEELREELAELDRKTTDRISFEHTLRDDLTSLATLADKKHARTASEFQALQENLMQELARFSKEEAAKLTEHQIKVQGAMDFLAESLGDEVEKAADANTERLDREVNSLQSRLADIGTEVREELNQHVTRQEDTQLLFQVRVKESIDSLHAGLSEEAARLARALDDRREQSQAETLSALGTVSQQLREETASLLSRAVEQVRGMHLAQSDDTPCHELHQRVDALALTFSELVAAHQATTAAIAILEKKMGEECPPCAESAAVSHHMECSGQVQSQQNARDCLQVCQDKDTKTSATAEREGDERVQEVGVAVEPIQIRVERSQEEDSGDSSLWRGLICHVCST